MAKEIIPLTALSTPNDWVLQVGTDKISAVHRPDDDLESYINSGIIVGVQQWYSADASQVIAAGDTINSVTVAARIKTGITNDTVAQIGVRVGPSGTISWSGNQAATSIWESRTSAFSMNPDNQPWTASDINNLEIGIKPVAPGTNTTWCTTLYAIVDYTSVIPVSPVISTVGPGRNYTTLEAWWLVAKTSRNPSQWAECYSGAPLGGLIWQPLQESESDEINFPRIYAATGEGHRGRLPSDPNTVARINGTIDIQNSGSVIGRIRQKTGEGCFHDVTSERAFLVLADSTKIPNNVIIDSPLVRHTNPQQASGVTMQIAIDGVSVPILTTTVNNAILYVTGNANSFTQKNGVVAVIINNSTNQTMNLNLNHWTVVSDADPNFTKYIHRAISFNAASSTNTMNENVNNGIWYGKTYNPEFTITEGPNGFYNSTSSNNLAQDNTPNTTLGDTANIVVPYSQIDTVFNNPASDWLPLKPASPAINNGIPVPGLDYDAIGNPRSLTSPTIGALEGQPKKLVVAYRTRGFPGERRIAWVAGRP